MKSYNFLSVLVIGFAVMGTYHLVHAILTRCDGSWKALGLLIRGRWRLLFGQCPACKHGWSDPEKQCGICGDHERKPDPLRRRCWWLAYKLHVQTLK